MITGKSADIWIQQVVVSRSCETRTSPTGSFARRIRKRGRYQATSLPAAYLPAREQVVEEITRSTIPRATGESIRAQISFRDSSLASELLEHNQSLWGLEAYPNDDHLGTAFAIPLPSGRAPWYGMKLRRILLGLLPPARRGITMSKLLALSTSSALGGLYPCCKIVL